MITIERRALKFSKECHDDLTLNLGRSFIYFI